MPVILALTVSLILPGQGRTPPVTLTFTQPSLEACQRAGATFVEDSTEERRFTFSCQVAS